MNTFKTFCPKISDAIQAMYDGLLDQDNRGSDYGIDMCHYVTQRHNVCFACAATCAIQKATGFTIEPNMISIMKNSASTADFKDDFELEFDELADVEDALDGFRSGAPDCLLEYYEVDPDEIPEKLFEDMENIWLTTEEWRTEIQALPPIIQALKEINL
ncbi:hypothetical protein AHIS2_p070 [Acaryochloris phage A-HIS2]|nr:hypothetical protein AHIS2_p070 [Acaryochloris phage A-HIS2]